MGREEREERDLNLFLTVFFCFVFVISDNIFLKKKFDFTALEV